MNEFVNTGFKDCEGISIFVGDTIKEGCNGLISTVEWRYEAGTFCLKGLGDCYNIKDSSIEWTVLNSNSEESPMYQKGKDIILSV